MDRMFGYDLPPGVSISDIPGNRPEDGKWEAIEEVFWDKKRLAANKGLILSRDEKTTMGQLLAGRNYKKADAIAAYIVKAIEFGMELGAQEERETAKENKGIDRMYQEETRYPYLRQYFKNLRSDAQAMRMLRRILGIKP